MFLRSLLPVHIRSLTLAAGQLCWPFCWPLPRGPEVAGFEPRKC